MLGRLKIRVVPGRIGHLAAMLAAVVLSTLAHAIEEHDLWYVIEIDGQRAGWVHEIARVQGDQLITENESQLVIKRGPTTIKVFVTSIFVETLDHRPLRWTVTQAIGASPTTTEFVFTDEAVEVTIGTGDAARMTTKPLPEDGWLTPGGASEFLSRRLRAGATAITIRSLDPSTGLKIGQTTYRVLGRIKAQALGRVVEAYEFEMESSAMAGMVTRGAMDENGLTVRSELAMGGLKITTIAADRALAMAEIDPPEMMRRLLIRSSKPIPNARRSRTASFVLRVDDGKLPDVPTTGVQQVERLDERSIRVSVSVDEIAPVLEDLETKRYLAATELADCLDASVVELAGDRKSATTSSLARRMRDVVARHIDEKDLGVGFASASEVARTGQGDCTEHAVLLAAVLRARGIPSRVVSGLIYADGFLGAEQIFGYHMWTQALVEVDGAMRWVDLDATLPLAGPIDATHIALTISDLADGETMNSLVMLGPLMGRLRVEVESVR